MNMDGLRTAVLAAMSAGKFEEAMETADQLTLAAPESPDGWLLKAKIHMLRSEPRLAVGLVDKAIERDGKSVAAWLQRAFTLHALGELPEATEAIAKAIGLGPGDGRSWLDIGAFHAHTGNPRASIEAVRKAMALDSSLRTEEAAFATLLNALEETGQFHEALELVRKIGPELSSAPPGYLALHEGVGLNGIREPGKALPVLAKAITDGASPEIVAAALVHQGLAHQLLGKPEDAIRSFSRALEMTVGGPQLRDPVRLYMASSHAASGNRKAALEVLRAIEAEHALPWRIAVATGELLGRLGQADHALRLLAATAEKHPAEWLPRYHTAGTQLLLGQWKESLSSIDEALRLAGGEKTAAMLFMKGGALWMLNDPDNALNAFEEAEALDSGVLKDLRYVDLRTSALLRLRRANDAAALMARISSDPALAKSSELAFMSIEVLRQSGQADTALQRLRSLAEGDTSEPGAKPWIVKAAARLMLGKPQAAMDALDRARTADPSVTKNLEYIVLYVPALLALDRHADALALIDAHPPAGPQAPWLELFRMNALAQEKRGSEALQACDRVLQLSRNHPNESILKFAALNQRGWVEAHDKAWEQAAESFARAEKTAQDAGDKVSGVLAMCGRALARFGASVEREGEARRQLRAEALQIAEAAAVLSDQAAFPFITSFAYWSKGTLLTMLEQDEKALLAFRRADAASEAPMVKLALAEAYARLEDHAMALKTFAAAAAIATSAKERGEASRGKAGALYHLGQYESSLDACREAIDAEGETESNLELVGSAYSALGRHEPALRSFRRAWALGTHGRRAVKVAIGLSAQLIAMKRDGEALAFLQQAEVDTEPNGNFYVNLARALMRTGNEGGARSALERAMSLGSPRAAEMLRQWDRAAGGGASWIGFWFGPSRLAQASIGAALVALLLMALAPALLTVNAARDVFPWIEVKKEWQIMLIPIALLGILLALPNLKGFKFAGIEIEVAQPKPEVGRPDIEEMMSAATLSLTSHNVALNPARVANTGAWGPPSR
jgi:tetratricopeptide (TPR) repeat protein